MKDDPNSLMSLHDRSRALVPTSYCFCVTAQLMLSDIRLWCSIICIDQSLFEINTRVESVIEQDTRSVLDTEQAGDVGKPSVTSWSEMGGGGVFTQLHPIWVWGKSWRDASAGRCTSIASPTTTPVLMLQSSSINKMNYLCSEHVISVMVFLS